MRRLVRTIGAEVFGIAAVGGPQLAPSIRLGLAYLPLAAIADETGFVDRSHLHRAFGAHYGCSPTQYRTSRQLPNIGSHARAGDTLLPHNIA